jgi:hypothetical protein
VRRGGRVAEGAPLLRVYTLTRIEGSNPFLSAILFDQYPVSKKFFYLLDQCTHPSTHP